MATTTLEAIRVALLKSVQAHVAPTETQKFGEKGFQPKDKQGRPSLPWEQMPATGIDRRFDLSLSPEESPLSFGGLSEHEAVAALVLTIGHVKSADMGAALSRRFSDVRKLANEVEDPAHYPSSVWAIKFSGHTTQKETEQFWITEMRFRVTYSEANV